MELNLGKIFGTRLLIEGPGCPKKIKFTIANSPWNWLVRIISWIWSPEFYSEENRRTINCFQKRFVDVLGPERLKRICTRYSIDLDEMSRKGSPLLSRHLAQILLGIRIVKVEDIDDLIRLSKQGQESWPQWISAELRTSLRRAANSEELSAATFAEVQRVLASPFGEHRLISSIGRNISGRASEFWARIQFNRFLADRESAELCKENGTDDFESWVHNTVARVIKRKPTVGEYIQAPNAPDGSARFYRVAAELVSGEGRVSYIFVPATRDTKLPSIRFERGSAFRTGEDDGISTLITDCETHLGRTAFESSLPYERYLADLPYDEIAGHSLGATQAQWELVRNGKIKRAYLFNGPGLPEEQLDAFNKRMEQSSQPLELVVRQSETDIVSSLGDAHLGCKAPKSIQIDYKKFYPPRTHKGTDIAHTRVWARARDTYYGMEGGFSKERIDEILYTKDSSPEWLRQTIGPAIAKAARIFRHILREYIGARELQEIGLKKGTYRDGQYHFEHIRLPATIGA